MKHLFKVLCLIGTLIIMQTAADASTADPDCPDGEQWDTLDDKGCIPCPSGTIWRESNSLCMEPCPKDSQWDATDNTCASIPIPGIDDDDGWGEWKTYCFDVGDGTRDSLHMTACTGRTVTDGKGKGGDDTKACVADCDAGSCDADWHCATVAG